jgi:hypothetical protein
MAISPPGAAPPGDNPRMQELDARMVAASMLWEQYLQASFPSRLRGAVIAEVDMMLLDADVIGCVVMWLGRRGNLDERRRDTLARRMKDLDLVLPLLTDVGERTYYVRLRNMAALASQPENQDETGGPEEVDLTDPDRAPR